MFCLFQTTRSSENILDPLKHFDGMSIDSTRKNDREVHLSFSFRSFVSNYHSDGHLVNSRLRRHSIKRKNKAHDELIGTQDTGRTLLLALMSISRDGTELANSPKLTIELHNQTVILKFDV